MKKYHYTTKKNAEKIIKEGMIPYKLEGNQILSILEYIPDFNGLGIYLWNEKLSKREELLSVLWQFTTKDDYELCQLEVEVEPDNFLKTESGLRVQLYHYQTLTPNKLPSVLLHDYIPSTIITRWINPKNIKIIKTYNILDLVK